MKTCPKCNAQCSDNAGFCPECGFSFIAAGPENQQGANQQAQNFQQGNNQQGYYQQQPYNNPQGNAPYGGYAQGPQPPAGQVATQRNIPISILLSLLTCNLYSIYWMIKLNNEINAVCGDYDAPSGGMVFLFSLITFGIYGHYWMYKMGEKCDRIKKKDGKSGILYLLLNIWLLGILSYALMQDTLNEFG